MTMIEVEQDVEKHLIERYKSKGNMNFYFKSNQFKKAMPQHDARVIGRVLTTKLQPKGIIELRSEENATRRKVWHTLFNGDKRNE